MEIVAKSKFIRISPRKMLLVAKAISGFKADKALDVLKNLDKRASRPILLTLKQGVANAVNNFKLEKDSLSIKKIQVSKGPTFKRGQPVARGQSHPIMKRTSHITIVLEGEEIKKGKDGAKS